MMRSEQINEISKAMSLAQGSIRGAKKESQNPFFKSHYADLQSVWDAIREPLSKNGLSVFQVTYLSGDLIILNTLLSHSSGQWVSGDYPIRPVKNDPQSLGSAITYARRYALMGIIGVCPVDDDGNAANKPALHVAESFAPAPLLPFETPAKSGDYIIPIGKKYKGKRLKDVQPDVLADFILWIQDEAHKKGEVVDGMAAEFIATTKQYFAEKGFEGLPE